MKNILKKIWNFIKRIIKYIILFFAWLFTPTKKKTSKKVIIEQKVEEPKSSKQAIESTTPIELPDEPISFENFKDDEYITYQKVNLEYDDEYLIPIIYKIYEKHYEIKLKDFTKEELKIVNKYTIKYLPNIKKELPKTIITDEEELKYKLKPIVEKQLEKEPLTKAFNNEVFFYTIEEKLIHTDKIKPEKADQKNKVKLEDIPKIEKKEEPKPEIIIKEPKLELQDKIINALAVGTILLSDISKEIVTKKEQEIKENITIQELEQKIKEQIEIEAIKEEPTKEEEKKEEEKTTKEDVIVQNKKIEEIKTESKIIEEYINEYSPYTPYLNNYTNQVERDYHHEKEKEEIEDRNYTIIEEHIDRLLTNIDEFLLVNENKLNKNQIDALNKQKEKLTNLKEELGKQKNLEIEQEQLALEQRITSEEITGLKDEINKVDTEKKEDYQKFNLNKPEDLVNIDPKQKAIIEKRLIKKQLKKAASVISISSLLFFPFIRNKFFFLLTKNKLIQKHLYNINEVLQNRSNNPEDINEDKIVNGESALNEGYNLNNENIDTLNHLYQESINKHPDLAFDNDFNFEYQYLKAKLHATQKKLDKKTSFFRKFLPKYKGKAKVLKKLH